MKKTENYNEWLSEKKKPAGAPDWNDSDAPDAEGRFRELGIRDLAAWLIKTRKRDMKKISGSITQQIVFNRKKDPAYAKKMEKVREEVYRQLDREDLLKKESQSYGMRHLQLFEDWSSGTLSASEINDYLREITPEDSDVPDYFMKIISKSGKTFHKKTLKIKDLLDKDKSLREYVESGEIRYGEGGESELVPDKDDLYLPIVVFNGEVLDGYNRTSTLWRQGAKTIEAWVA